MILGKDGIINCIPQVCWEEPKASPHVRLDHAPWCTSMCTYTTNSLYMYMHGLNSCPELYGEQKGVVSIVGRGALKLE